MDRQRALDEKKAAVSEAIEKTKQELQTSPAASSDDVSKKHAEELKALEAKLAKEHQAALAAAKQTQPATSQSEQATIDAAIAAGLTFHKLTECQPLFDMEKRKRPVSCSVVLERMGRDRYRSMLEGGRMSEMTRR